MPSELVILFDDQRLQPFGAYQPQSQRKVLIDQFLLTYLN